MYQGKVLRSSEKVTELLNYTTRRNIKMNSGLGHDSTLQGDSWPGKTRGGGEQRSHRIELQTRLHKLLID